MPQVMTFAKQEDITMPYRVESVRGEGPPWPPPGQKMRWREKWLTSGSWGVSGGLQGHRLGTGRGDSPPVVLACARGSSRNGTGVALEAGVRTLGR